MYYVAREGLPFRGDVPARLLHGLGLCIDYDSAVVRVLEE